MIKHFSLPIGIYFGITTMEWGIGVRASFFNNGWNVELAIGPFYIFVSSPL